MTAGSLQLLREIDVVLQAILGTSWVENITRIANCAFRQFSGLAYGINSNAHVFDPIQAIEDAEDVHAGFRRLLHKMPHHVVGIIGVPHSVCAAQQHL